MPEVSQKTNKLAAGYITDINPLEGAPSGATIDESNFHLLPDGSRKKRKGLIVENDSSSTTTGDATDGPIAANYPYTTTFLYRNLQSVDNRSLLYIHSGIKIHSFGVEGHHSLAGLDPLEDGVNVITLENTDLAYQQALVRNQDLTFASGPGFALVVGANIQPSRIVSGAVLPFYPKIRTFFRADDSLTANERPTSLTAEHKFNLLNQGWTSTDITAFQTHASNTLNVYPSNSDVYDPTSTYPDYLTADTRNALAPNGSLISAIDLFHDAYTPHDNIDWSTSQRVISGMSNVANAFTATVIGTTTDFTVGEYLWYVNGFNATFKANSVCIITAKTASTVTFTWPFSIADFTPTADGGITPLNDIINPETSELNLKTDRFSTTTFYAGRAWYSGIVSGDKGSSIYFSKVVESEGDLSICYQAADPTNLTISAPVSTDGGVITIPEAGIIYNLISYKNSLVVLAENGVWSISGSRGDVFNALSFQVYQLDNTPTYKNKSAVVGNNFLYYNTQSGIAVVGLSEDGLRLQAQSLTDGRLSTFMSALGEDALASLKGMANPLDDSILWIYRNDPSNFGLDSYLIFHPYLNAFTKGTLPSDIIANKIGIVDILPVFSRHDSNTPPYSSWKFLELRDDSGTWRIRSYGFDVINNTEPEGYLTTWPTNLGDLKSNKKFDGVTTAFKITETDYSTDGSGDIQLTPSSGCTIQGRFDNDVTGAGNKWGSSKEAYRLTRLPFLTGSGTLDLGYDTLVTNNAIRGSGEFVQLHFNSPAGKSCHLLGWHSIIKTKRSRG